MRATQYSLSLLVLFATALSVGAAENQDSAALAAILKSDAPKAEKGHHLQTPRRLRQ